MKLILALVLMVGCGKPWTTTNKVLMTSTFTMIMTDFAQTTEIVNDCAEMNPIIGPCGERVHIMIYFPVVITAIAVMTDTLPPRWRNYLLGTLTVTQSYNTYRNEKLGWHVF